LDGYGRIEVNVDSYSTSRDIRMKALLWAVCLSICNVFTFVEQSYCAAAIADSSRDSTYVLRNHPGGPHGVFYGDDYRFGVLTPKGWTMDDTSGRHGGKIAEYFPEGFSWQESKAVMYITVSSKKVKGHESLTEVMQDDSVQSVHDAPDIRIERMDPLATSDHKIVAVRSFDFSNHEVVAYVDEKSVVVMLFPMSISLY